MLKAIKAAYHMTGKDGVYNTKFVLGSDGNFEAVYDKDGNLVTTDTKRLFDSNNNLVVNVSMNFQ